MSSVVIAIRGWIFIDKCFCYWDLNCKWISNIESLLSFTRFCIEIIDFFWNIIQQLIENAHFKNDRVCYVDFIPWNRDYNHSPFQYRIIENCLLIKNVFQWALLVEIESIGCYQNSSLIVLHTCHIYICPLESSGTSIVYRPSQSWLTSNMYI